MILGIGTDIVEIKRIKDAVEKWGGHFLKKIYTDNEILYCNKKKDPYPHLAARFAAKEAFIKALSSEDRRQKTEAREQTINPGTPNFKDIEVMNHANGKPYIMIKDDLLNASFKSDEVDIHVTLSHERTHAVATVILERTAK